jgi:hypothetical protein
MRVRARAYWAPKAGSLPDEYEDAFWPPRDVDKQAHGFRVAVGDGATESSYSALWARLLVRAYCRGELVSGRRQASLRALGRAWHQQVSAGPLPWYAEQKLEQGAFSSLLGLQLDERGVWRATGVGDTCLFHMRQGGLTCAFPLDRSEDFTNSPVLIGSVERHNRCLEAHMREACGEWDEGDVFYLMTDAVACWYLRCVESGGAPPLPSRRPWFRSWLARMRRDGAIRNDDTTVLRVEML